MAKASREKSAAKPLLLSGGNPQIPMGYGAAPVKAFIAAAPGWKKRAVKRLDSIITHALPNVAKAVKYNSPLYGVETGRWFLSLHCFTHYVKATFFDGAALTPPPPGAGKQKNVRWLDIYESDEIDEAQITAWVMAASRLPGEKL